MTAKDISAFHVQNVGDFLRKKIKVKIKYLFLVKGILLLGFILNKALHLYIVHSGRGWISYPS